MATQDKRLWDIVSALTRGETIPTTPVSGSMKSSLFCATLSEFKDNETLFRQEVYGNTALQNWAESLNDEQLAYLISQNS